MPLYQFTCEACDETVDLFLKMGETKRKCPSCGKLKLRKDITCPTYIDTYSPMSPRKGRGRGGAGRIKPGEGLEDFYG